MILSALYKGKRIVYVQPKLPWYFRIIGMKYGPGWHIYITDAEKATHSETFTKSPNPALVMRTVLELLDDHEKVVKTLLRRSHESI